jgi:hypothetical protein
MQLPVYNLYWAVSKQCNVMYAYVQYKDASCRVRMVQTHMLGKNDAKELQVSSQVLNPIGP